MQPRPRFEFCLPIPFSCDYNRYAKFASFVANVYKKYTFLCVCKCVFVSVFMYVYMYVYMCMTMQLCVCVCVCVRERERT